MLTLLLVIGIILFALWMLGLISRRTFGGFLHIAFVIAVILIIIWGGTGGILISPIISVV
jgi:hypothetical protein